jgi:nucleoside 2-deoxyribosyltransferase
VYAELVEALLQAGHMVPTAVNADLGSPLPESTHDPEEVYSRDTRWIDESDVLIAEVSTPSHGVGYEVSYALERGKAVLCLHRNDVTISKMLSGNTMRGIRVESYADVAEAISLANEFLAAHTQLE